MKDESARCNKIKLGRLCGYVVGSKFINSTLGTDTHSLVAGSAAYATLAFSLAVLWSPHSGRKSKFRRIHRDTCRLEKSLSRAAY